MHLTDDDIFISIEMKDCKKAREEAEKDKNLCQQHQTNEENALEILSVEGVGPKMFSLPQLNCLLAWHQVNDLPPKARKKDKLSRWIEIVALQKTPTPYMRWTDEDKQQLIALQSNVISIGNTMYGREVALKKRELDAEAHTLTWEERDALQQKLDTMVASKIDADKADVTAETMPAAMEGLESF